MFLSFHTYSASFHTVDSVLMNEDEYKRKLMLPLTHFDLWKDILFLYHIKRQSYFVQCLNFRSVPTLTSSLSRKLSVRLFRSPKCSTYNFSLFVSHCIIQYPPFFVAFLPHQSTTLTISPHHSPPYQTSLLSILVPLSVH